jgi:hypothetical protein
MINKKANNIRWFILVLHLIKTLTFEFNFNKKNETKIEIH